MLNALKNIQFIPARVLINVFLLLLVSSGLQASNLYLPEPDTAAVEKNTDTLGKENFQLSAEVVYSAEDSIVFDLNNQRIYLYGNANIDFEGIHMDAAYMEFSFTDNMIYARGTTDSLGNPAGKPHFSDGQQEMTAAEIAYNTKTKKGIIKEVRAQQGEGYIHMGVSKKHGNNEIHLQHGKYTTCDLDHPHYYFNLTKAIIIPDDKIVSGPVNLVVADIPTPLALPFGFFPNQKRESKGIVIPQYGESPALGFYLLNGGYYFPVGKKGRMDMQLLGDIYSRGSWGLKNITRYNTRYKYSGGLNLSYTDIKRSDPEYPDYSNTKSFFIRWNHTQDPKANPYSRFNATVNFGTLNNFKNNFNTVTSDYLSNTFQSNIAYNYSFPNKPFNLSANLKHNQNSLTGIVNFTLPELAFNVNRIYPFAKLNKQKTGTKKFYEYIGFIYSSNLKNDVTIQDSLLSLDNLDAIKSRMRNGMRQSASLSTTIKVLKQHFSLNPSVSITERWYLQTIKKYWDNDLQSVITDTVQGFARAGDYNAALSLTTKFFVFYKSKGKKETTIRHVVTPNVNFAMHPDFSTAMYGYYGANGTYSSYSPFDIGIYGQPPRGSSGNLSMNIINNIEMKYKPKRDTSGGYKKVVLIENFTINGSYNIYADSLNLSNINLSGRTRLWNNLGLVYSSSLDPYLYKDGVITNNLMLNSHSGIGKFSFQSLAVTFGLKSKKRKGSLPQSKLTEDDKNEVDRNSNLYVDFTIPWTLNLNYNIRTNLIRQSGKDSVAITQAVNFNGDILLTENWKVGFTSGYDFVNNKFTYTTIDIYRDLHCWEMRFNWIPFGTRKSYMIQINVKSSMLQDLKLMRRRSWYDFF